MATITRKAIITEEDLLTLGDTRSEVINGELVIMSPNKVDHSFYSGRMVTFLNAFNAVRNLGTVFGDMGIYLLKKASGKGIKDSKVPDASFVTYERLPADAPINRTLPFAPNLAIEVISEGENEEDIQKKVNSYLDAGTEQVWLLYINPQHVRVCSADQPEGMVLGLEDTLTGGDLLPGFAIPVRVIFDRGDQALYAETLRKLLEVTAE